MGLPCANIDKRVKLLHMYNAWQCPLLIVLALVFCKPTESTFVAEETELY